jgi:type I restriction enzyme R subunit
MLATSQRKDDAQRRMNLHKEINFEVEICDHLGANGWLYAVGDAANYDRMLALYPADVLAWVQAAHPKAWKSLSAAHGENAGTVLVNRLRDCIRSEGTLHVLRNGIDVFGLKGKLEMAQFKPALAMNLELMARHQANRLRVVRQVKYSTVNENCIDLALFLNGIPVATAELKSDFTQSVKDAVNQYRFDRDPRPKGSSAEPLLSFPSGALVHFAVSNTEVQMTTKLEGAATRFLPFNKGYDGGAGNVPSIPGVPDALIQLVPEPGHPTAYLWEEVWQRESWLEIVGRYLVAEKDKKKQLTRVIFPRFHQLQATRKLVAAARTEGAGHKYLIQHSAGSGKTNTIAWTAHFFADLHGADQKKVFDTVVVVSDRNVIDQQLQEAVYGFERNAGVVASIKGDGGSKSAELAQALSQGKKIVVCTIQTFPALFEKMEELARGKGTRYAVIADEAHSSQSGESVTKLKAVLNAEELKELEDGGEISSEDMLAARMAGRVNLPGISFVAFTATPKPKTMELFGRRPDPSKPAGPGNTPGPFHVYSMRQAIEEGFILDVLQNYTSYKLAFKLAHQGKEMDEAEVERSAALKGLMRWVRLHDYNISQKVQVVVEHFRENVQLLLKGHAKAMVVVGSRLEAVRWKLAIDKYIQSSGYELKALVAFSGEVIDKESGPDPFTETSKILNPSLKGRDMREAFKTDEYQVLLVANKFQTGFDEPLLCGMYVDKRLAGIQAVQTLSRLNRSYDGPFGKKQTTFVLDFQNEPAEILAAFKMYYDTAQLEDVTDPNLVFNLRTKLDATGCYDDFEVERVVAVLLKPDAKQGELVAALTPVVNRLTTQFKAAQLRFRIARDQKDERARKEAWDEMEALLLFKSDIASFLRVYTFLSQIFDYGNTEIEKRYLFYKVLLPLLDFSSERTTIDFSQVVLTHHALKNKGKQGLNLGVGPNPTLQPLTETGSGSVQEKEKALLREIIAKVNDLFDGELTEDDKLVYVNDVIKGKLLESELLMQQAANNTKEQFANSPDLTNGILYAIMDALAAHSTMSKQALESEKLRSGLKDVLLGPAQLYESLRAKGVSSRQDVVR